MSCAYTCPIRGFSFTRGAICRTTSVSDMVFFDQPLADDTHGRRDLPGGKDLECFYCASAANSTIPTR
jgi:hypothetical protein